MVLATVYVVQAFICVLCQLANEANVFMGHHSMQRQRPQAQ
jgi:hypothetical protein